MKSGTVLDIGGLVPIVRERGRKARSITAIAGPPGSGKSTLADNLAKTMNEEEPGSAAVLAMDGYHFDDMILVPRGWRPRKGAPHTFDVAGFAAMLSRLRANSEAEIAVPVFDRDIEIARNSARLISAAVRHLIVEGNYLLLDHPPWSDLSVHFDTKIFLNVPMTTLRTRLESRWKGITSEERKRKLDDNDLPNAEFVLKHSRNGEFVMRNY
jgi:pantothenate kinase